jgi:hypothetical protein
MGQKASLEGRAARGCGRLSECEAMTMIRRGLVCLVMGMAGVGLVGQTTGPATQGNGQKVGEKFASEDAVIWDFHGLGEVNGTQNLYRSASPVRDLEKKSGTPGEGALAEAKVRLQRLYDKGIRTIVSLEIAPPPPAATQPGVARAAGDEDKGAWMAIEQEAAKAVGIQYVAHPMANKGEHSLETMTDAEVKAWLEEVSADLFKYAKDGGVDFHCSAGHDRTGIVTAYLRMKYEGWPVEKAIQEMRDYGHNWPKFSKDGGVSSWHEAHLRAMAGN